MMISKTKIKRNGKMITVINSETNKSSKYFVRHGELFFKIIYNFSFIYIKEASAKK